MISTAEVANLAHRLGVGDRVIEKDYNHVGPLRARLGTRHLKVDITRGELLLHPCCGMK